MDLDNSSNKLSPILNISLTEEFEYYGVVSSQRVKWKTSNSL